jgi:hypothetical protein
VTFTKGNKHGRVYKGIYYKKLPSISSLEDKLDALFSQYIRRSHADEGGTVSCVTCKKLMFWKDSDCGHWIKRQHRAVRWDERNVAPQCTRCNHFQGGAQDEFSGYIIATHGADVHAELLRLKHTVFKVTRLFLEERIQYYKAKGEAL